MPQRQDIKGDLTLHVLVQKHDLPGNTTEAAGVDLSEWRRSAGQGRAAGCRFRCVPTACVAQPLSRGRARPKARPLLCRLQARSDRRAAHSCTGADGSRPSADGAPPPNPHATLAVLRF